MSDRIKYKGGDFFLHRYSKVSSFASIPKSPTSIDEFRKAGLTESAINHYFDLVKILYAEMLIDNQQAVSSDSQYALKIAWLNLEQFCCNQNLIRRLELDSGIILPQGYIFNEKPYKIIEYYEVFPWDIFVRSFDEFRRQIEILLGRVDLPKLYLQYNCGVTHQFELGEETVFPDGTSDSGIFDTYWRHNEKTGSLERLSKDDLCTLQTALCQEIEKQRHTLNEIKNVSYLCGVKRGNDA